MAARFFYVDIHFFHKNTYRVLLDELGPWGPLMWLALIAQGKNHRPAGEFTWTSEADALQQLFGAEVAQADVPFTFEDFLKITGRMKQTRRAKTDRRRRGRVANVALTGWERWQKESRTWSERERKARDRTGREDGADAARTGRGRGADAARTGTVRGTDADKDPANPVESKRTDSGHDADIKRTKTASSSRTTTTPKPPEENQNGKTPHRHDCPSCGARQPSKSALEDHLRIFHPTNLDEHIPEHETVPPHDLHDTTTEGAR